MKNINAHKSKKEMDMIHGKLLGKLIIFVIPVMLSGILQLLFNAADVVVVGRFAGDESLAAVGSTGALINLLTNLFIGLSVGVNVVVAHFYGSNNRSRIPAAVHTGIMVAVICGLFMTLIGVLFADDLLILMSTPADVLGLATIYLRIYFLGMPAMMVYNFGAAILRASGDTKRPLYFLTAAGVVNVGLNLLFVIVFQMGVEGVGWATVISQYMSAAMIMICLIWEKEELHFSVKLLKIDKQILLRIIKIGLPAGLQGTVFSLSNVVIQSSVNSFGKLVVAGNAAASNLEGFVYIAMNSFHQTAITFVGQNYGAGDRKRVLKVTLLCMTMVTIVGLVLGNLMVVFGRPLLEIYSQSRLVVDYGYVRLQYICTIYCLCGMMDTMVGALRGVGYSIAPMIVSILGACGLRLVYIATIFSLIHTQECLYLSYPISWFVTLCVHILIFTIVYRKKLPARMILVK